MAVIWLFDNPEVLAPVRIHTMRVLIVEGNPVYGRLLADRLERAGFAVDLRAHVANSHDVLVKLGYAAILLDLGLPDADGLKLLQRLRAAGKTTPVIVMTARGSLDDKVTGLSAGADDYMVKPFSFDELLARLHVLLRRPDRSAGDVLRCANVLLDIGNHTLAVDGHVVLTRTRELEILALLMRSPGQVVRREKLARDLFGRHGDRDQKSLDVHMHRLRKALATVGAGIAIHSIRGLGFLLTESPPEAAASSAAIS